MKIKKLLYESFDRELSKEEQGILNKTLVESDSLREEYDKLKKLRSFVSSNSSGDFKAGFEDNLMEKMHLIRNKPNRESVFFNSLSLLFKKITYVTIIILVITLSYNFTRSGNISLESAIGIKQQQSTLADSFYNNLYSIFK